MPAMMKVLLALSVFVAVGCGGSDDDDSATDALDSGDADVDAADSGDSGDDEGGSDDSGGSGGLNTAIISVGDQSFEFEWDSADGFQRCSADSFGAFAANADRSDGIGFEAEFPIDDQLDIEPKVEVGGDGESGYWTADPEENAAIQYDTWPAVVDSFEVNGTAASGTATFVGNTPIGEEPVGVPGTFEITCAG